MKLAQIQLALSENRQMYRVYFTGGTGDVTGRITEVHNEYIMMRYVRHPTLEDLRIFIATDAIVAIEEQ